MMLVSIRIQPRSRDRPWSAKTTFLQRKRNILIRPCERPKRALGGNGKVKPEKESSHSRGVAKIDL